MMFFKECNGKGDAVTVYDGPGLPQGNSPLYTLKALMV